MKGKPSETFKSETLVQRSTKLILQTTALPKNEMAAKTASQMDFVHPMLYKSKEKNPKPHSKNKLTKQKTTKTKTKPANKRSPKTNKTQL